MSRKHFVGMAVWFFFTQMKMSFMGKERYVQSILAEWIDTPYWIWILCVVLTLSLDAFFDMTEKNDGT